MKRVDTIARVRRAFHIQGWSVKKIVRELHVSRNTVRKILRSGETDFSYERERQPMPRLGPWQDRLEQMLGSRNFGGSDTKAVMMQFVALPKHGRTTGALRPPKPMCRCRMLRVRLTSSTGATRSC